MLEKMSYKELNLWIDFYSIEPFPEERADFRNAQLMAMIANVNRDPKKTRAFSPDKFLVDYWKERKSVTPESTGQMFHTAMAINAAIGGKVIKREEYVQ